MEKTAFDIGVANGIEKVALSPNLMGRAIGARAWRTAKAGVKGMLKNPVSTLKRPLKTSFMQHGAASVRGAGHAKNIGAGLERLRSKARSFSKADKSNFKRGFFGRGPKG